MKHNKLKEYILGDLKDFDEYERVSDMHDATTDIIVLLHEIEQRDKVIQKLF